uniref:Secreted protein n=1 Tax=Haemonchus placei TaxID=6290 RepID=A0A0N4WLC5_HAEPC
LTNFSRGLFILSLYSFSSSPQFARSSSVISLI